MKAFLRPHRFRHPYPVRFYTTKTQSGHPQLKLAAVQPRFLSIAEMMMTMVGPSPKIIAGAWQGLIVL